ncbi:hypothetical protein D920_00161 [Enterococcus faecalis 13-SD-W-01]|nr:hypothetical protein D920_00161 [Enterococcus faecalis 13-SD-W-01]
MSKLLSLSVAIPVLQVVKLSNNVCDDETGKISIREVILNLL